ncbi:MAG TPA: dihydrolipoamide acetyltransferase family protein [Thermodesulfobacteriota bacterium]|nr:dihydrolipoamide acetyltransferase family protein [Thermodesulfobacteriota bacterium]
MPFEFKFPDIGEGLTEGEIVRWLVKEGDGIKEGQPLVEVETDKALAEIPSPRTGVILKIMAKEKEVVKVGQVIVVIGEKGEAVAGPPPKPSAPPPKPRSVGVVGELEEAPEEAVAVAAKVSPMKTVLVSEHALATPAVRALARELGVDINKVRGTGSEGRVLEKDVRQHAEEKARPAEEVKKPAKVKKYDLYGYVERIPLRGVRRSIAKAMVKSKYTAPHVSAMDEADVTELWQIREKEKKVAEGKGIKLTILPFVIKAVIAGLTEHPYLNATLDDDSEEIILKKYFNIGLATDTPEGLMVPVVKLAKEKSIFDLAQESAQLAEKARNRTIDLADLKGGTFTITNYGAVRGIYGTPIINHPEVAILGIGRIEEKPVVRDGKVAIRRILPLSLSFDHRVVDGAEAARFLQTVIARLEDPDLILLET